MIEGIYEAHLPVTRLERSIPFYEKLGLTLAFRNEKMALLWIKEGESWIGLWESDRAELPYHPSIRHVAFRIQADHLETVQAWLSSREIAVRTAFRMPPEEQPLVLPNFPFSHGAIYFEDPDGNSIELITYLKREDEPNPILSYEEWKTRQQTN